MFSRFEYDVNTGNRAEILQRAYLGEDGTTIVLDDGVSPPKGFVECAGEIVRESNEYEE